MTNPTTFLNVGGASKLKSYIFLWSTSKPNFLQNNKCQLDTLTLTNFPKTSLSIPEKKKQALLLSVPTHQGKLELFMDKTQFSGPLMGF